MYLLLVLAAVALLLSGCGSGSGSGSCEVEGSGPKETKTMDLSSYTKVEVGSAIETQVSIGTENAFSITLYSNVVDYLDVQVVDDTLRIKMKDGKDGACNAQAKAIVTVTSQLEGLMASGASRVTVDKLNGPLDASDSSRVDVTDTLSSGSTITCSGSSSVEIEKFTSPSPANIDCAGSSSLEVKSGSFPDATVTVIASGSSKIKFDNFIATRADLSTSGSSSVRGLEVNTLTVNAGGGSEIESTVKETASGSCSGSATVTIVGGAVTTIDKSGSCTVVAEA